MGESEGLKEDAVDEDAYEKYAEIEKRTAEVE